MKKVTRIITTILAVLMIVTSVPLNVFASEDKTFNDINTQSIEDKEIVIEEEKEEVSSDRGDKEEVQADEDKVTVKEETKKKTTIKKENTDNKTSDTSRVKSSKSSVSPRALSSISIDSITFDGEKRMFVDENGVKTIHLGKYYPKEDKYRIPINITTVGSTIGLEGDTSDETLGFISDEDGYWSFASNDKIYLNVLGTGSFTVSLKDNENSSINDTVKIIVEDIPTTGITLSQSNITLERTKTYQLKANIEPWNASNTSVTWTSDDPTVASVDSKDKVTAKKVGSAVITATNSNGQTASCNITVKESKVTSVKLNRTSFSTSYKKNVQLKATAYPSYAENRSIKWSTSNSKIATVTSKGYVKTTGRYGSCYIYAKAADGSGKYARCKITTFKNKVKSLKLSKSKVTISKKGRTYKLKASVKGKNSKYRATNNKIKWKSSNKKIATVSSSGKVKAKRYGKCYIYAYSRDNKKIKKRCKVTVKKVKLKKMSASAYVEFTNFSNFKKGLIGSKKKIKVKLNPSSPTDSKVYYKSSNKKVATVNSKGTVTAKGYGMCNITVTTHAKVKGKKIKRTVPVYVNGGSYYYVNGYKMSIVLNEVNKRRKAKGYAPLTWSTSSWENKRVRSWTNRFYSWSESKFYKMGERDSFNVHDIKWIDRATKDSSQKFSESVGWGRTTKSYPSQSSRDSSLKRSSNAMIIHDNKIVTNKNIKYFTSWVSRGKISTFFDIRSY